MNDLSLVAIGLFLVDNGCDLAAENKEWNTAIDVSRSSRSGTSFIEVFELEAKRYCILNKMRCAPSSHFVSKDKVSGILLNFRILINVFYCHTALLFLL